MCVRKFVCTYARMFVCPFVRTFAYTYVRVFVCSCIRMYALVSASYYRKILPIIVNIVIHEDSITTI